MNRISSPENISEKKSFWKVKRLWVLSIVIMFVVSFILFLIVHKASLLQEGNPLYYSSAIIQLIGLKDYVDVTKQNDKDLHQKRYITYKDDSKELFDYIEREYNVKFQDKMGNSYTFINNDNNSYLKIKDQTYMKYYTLWEVNELKYR